MLIVVADTSGAEDVVGLDGADPSALLRAHRAQPAQHVVVLTPWYAGAAARRQAHVVVAAHPSVKVCVLAHPHHPLTLALLASAVLRRHGVPGGWTDPGEAVQLLNQGAARSRSLVWHPRVQGLQEPTPSLGDLARGLFRPAGFFGEVGVSAGLTAGRSGLTLRSGETLWTAGEPPALLRSQLGDLPVQVSPATVAGPRPYATRSSVELTALVPPGSAVRSTPCPVCSASLSGTGCGFCGSLTRPAVDQVRTLPVPEPVGAGAPAPTNPRRSENP